MLQKTDLLPKTELFKVKTLSKAYAKQISVLKSSGTDLLKLKAVRAELESGKLKPLGWCRNALDHSYFSDYAHVLLVEWEDRLYWMAAPGDNYDRTYGSKQLFVG